MDDVIQDTLTISPFLSTTREPMTYCSTMTEVECDVDSRYDDVDVESILARVEKRPLISRTRFLYRAPEFIQKLPSEETVEEGSTVCFGCKVLGFPHPTVTWYKDDDVIGPDSRAYSDVGDNGTHSLHLHEVSKCDAGTYKVRATNMEGSSANCLYLAVKAKSKSRNRKKKKTRTVACAPLFPAIVEHEAEERRQTLEVERQPESPLTPLYTNISRRSPVTWPAFLGDWAYSMDIDHQEMEDLDMGCEDVFESDSDEPVHTLPPHGSLTFVSSAYAELNDNPDTHTPNNKPVNSNNTDAFPISSKPAEKPRTLNLAQTRFANDSSSDVERKNEINCNHSDKPTVVASNGVSINDILNNNKASTETAENVESRNKIHDSCDVVPIVSSITLEEKAVYIDSNTVSKIAVNRSYAKGDCTFSVARRSPSPLSSARKPLALCKNNSPISSDTTMIQNLNNERILRRLQQSDDTKWWPCRKWIWSCDTFEDHVAEVILLICGCTFFALCVDLPPSTFVFNVLLAFVVKMLLGFLLD